MPGSSRSDILVSGNLASRRRTVTGVLGQLGLAGIPDQEVPGVLRLAGLPARAAEDPDFPISLDQELVVLSLMLQRLTRRASCTGFSIETFKDIGINHYGVLGLAMQHADSAVAALRVMVTYPELSWGHVRIVASRLTDTVVLAFEMGAQVPEHTDVAAGDLREYCVMKDLVSVERLIRDILGRSVPPALITLPYPEPRGYRPRSWVPCPVRFDAPEATLRYPIALLDAVPVHAGALPFRRYEKVTRWFSRMLADDTSIAEQVSQLLWAYSPAPSREDLADMLAMGTRTLARKLHAEGTSYNTLLRRVQTERAGNFLRHSSLPLGEIAERMGYSDPAAFTRAFHAWTGMAPSRWRKQHRR